MASEKNENDIRKSQCRTLSRRVAVSAIKSGIPVVSAYQAGRRIKRQEEEAADSIKEVVGNTVCCCPMQCAGVALCCGLSWMGTAAMAVFGCAAATITNSSVCLVGYDEESVPNRESQQKEGGARTLVFGRKLG